MSPKPGTRSGGSSGQPAHTPFMGFGPRPPFMVAGGPFLHPPFMAHFPGGRGGRGGFPLWRGPRGAGRCHPPFQRRRPEPCFERRGCWSPFRLPVMGDRVFQGAWWGAPHRWHYGSRRRRHSIGTDAMTAATFELARALWTLSREDGCSDEEEQETSCSRSGQENEKEAHAGAEAESSSETQQKERGDGQQGPICCRSEDVWEDCGQGSWMTEVEVWPYAEDEVEAYVLEDGRVEVRCEHDHGATPVSSSTQVLPCPPCGPATLTTAHGPPSAKPGVMVLLVTPKESEKEPAPAEGEESAPAEGEELAVEEDAEIVDISDSMEKC